MAESVRRTSETLPRGRHGLPRQFVAQNQRERLMEAMAQVVAARGYPGTTVAHVLEQARVSRRTFYELFEDREDCFLAAYDAIVVQLFTVVREAYDSEQDWPLRIRRGITALLGFMAAEPDFARMCMVEALAAGPRAMQRYLGAVDAFLPFFADGRRYVPGGEELPPATERAVVSGVAGVIYRQISEGRTEKLPELLPDAVAFALSPFLGPGEALRIARTPA